MMLCPWLHDDDRRKRKEWVKISLKPCPSEQIDTDWGHCGPEANSWVTARMTERV
jgi:hypothetical protein